jgi:hypothetical protein
MDLQQSWFPNHKDLDKKLQHPNLWTASIFMVHVFNVEACSHFALPLDQTS